MFLLKGALGKKKPRAMSSTKGYFYEVQFEGVANTKSYAKPKRSVRK